MGKKGGMLLVDTINRTFLAYLVVLVGAEYVLGAAPLGSHDWRLFITPEELITSMEASGFSVFRNFPGFRPTLPMIIDLVRALLLRSIPVLDVRGGCVLQASPGMVSYFGTATAV